MQTPESCSSHYTIISSIGWCRKSRHMCKTMANHSYAQSQSWIATFGHCVGRLSTSLTCWSTITHYIHIISIASMFSDNNIGNAVTSWAVVTPTSEYNWIDVINSNGRSGQARRSIATSASEGFRLCFSDKIMTQDDQNSQFMQLSAGKIAS